MRFGGRKREEKLYKQWAKYAGLPEEAIPQKEAPEAKPGRRFDMLRLPDVLRRPNAIYILLGISIGVLAAGLILLFIQSC